MSVIASREFEVTFNISPDDDYDIPLSRVSNWQYECEIHEVSEEGSIFLESASGSTPAEAAQKAFDQLGLSYFEPTWSER